MKIVLLSLLLAVSSLLKGQDLFVKFYTNDNKYFQYKGDVIQEHNGKLYVFGMAMDTTILSQPSNNPERNLHVTEFDMDGNLLKTSFWDTPGTDDDLITLYGRDVHLYDGNFIMPFYSDFEDCVASIDTALQEEIKLVACDTEDPLDRRNTLHSVIWPTDNNLVVFKKDINRDILITTLDLDDPSEFSIRNIAPVLDYNYSVKEAYILDDNNLIVNGSYAQWTDGNEGDLYGEFFIKLDEAYNVVDYNFVDTSILSSSFSFGRVLGKDGNYIIATNRIDREYYNERGNVISYPMVMKVDSSNFEIIWETPYYDSGEFRKFTASLAQMVEAKDGSGYIIVGNGYEREDGGRRVVTYGKISKEGEMLWRKELDDDFPPSSLWTDDVVATSDGHYVATGYRSDSSSDDSYDTRVQLMLFKFDNDGNILQTSSTKNELKESAISVVPNPAKDKLRVTVDIEGALQIKVMSMTGETLMSQESTSNSCVLDISHLVTGTYLIMISGQDHVHLGQEKFIIQR